jgi:ABC-type polysaccharide/polyol phosphate export permease
MATSQEIRRVHAAVRPGPLSLISEGFRDIWSRRRLTRYLVQADMAKHGADTVLGNIWWVLDPLLQMAVYVVLVSVIFKRGGPDYPLFVFAAILPWKWYSSSVNDAITSVTAREAIIKQVKFPKIVLPVASTVGGIVSFAFGLIPLFAMVGLFYSDRLSASALLIPAVALVQFVFTLATCVAMAAINVFFRDLGNLARHLLRLWFYLSPGLYSVKDIDESKYGILAQLFKLNPWTTLFESYRDVLYNGVTPAWGALALLLVASLALLAGATLFFKRLEPAFAKVI